MQIKDNHASVQHVHTIVLALVDAPSIDAKINYRQRGMITPVSARCSWTWDYAAPGWVRSKVVLSGRVLKKDGTPGLRYGSTSVELDFLAANIEWHPVVDAILAATPTEVVVAS